jgi:hypothetical protein
MFETCVVAGGIYLTVSCDWCGVEAEPGVRHERRQDALSARTRVARYDGWLLKRPKGVDAVLLCPDCCAEGR